MVKVPRQTGKPALPLDIASAAIAAYAAGQSQAQVKNLLAEWGFDVCIGTVQRLLSGKTYRNLYRPSAAERGDSKAVAARRRARRHPTANPLKAKEMVRTSGPRPGAGPGRRITPTPGEPMYPVKPPRPQSRKRR